MSRSQLARVLAFAGIGAVAFASMLWITRGGLGVSPDSIVYLSTAKNLLGGNGFFDRGHPMTHYPPGYPMLLAAVGFLNSGDVLNGARWLHAALFAYNVVLTGVAVMICTRRSLAAACIAMLFLLLSAPMLAVHSMLWSEPPFIALTLTGFLLLTRHVAVPDRRVLLLGSSALGLAISTRFVGVILIPILGMILLVASDRPVFARRRDAIIGMALASLPLGAWILRNVATANKLSDWKFSFHPADFGHVRALLNTLHDFVLAVFVPDMWKVMEVAVALVLVGLGISYLSRRRYFSSKSADQATSLRITCAAYFVAYVTFVLFSISFLDARTPLDDRILLPALLLLLVAVIGLAWVVAREAQNMLVWKATLFFLLLCTGINAKRAVAEAIDIRANGRAFNSTAWRNSPTLSALVKRYPSRTVYSNGEDAIWFRTARNSVSIPREVNPDTELPNGDYARDMVTMCEAIRSGEAVLVYLNGVNWRWYVPSAREIEAQCFMSTREKFADGVIYSTRVH
ncbi:MAG TPA: hypothetical protein VES88_04495 [Gemmatimonadaceae bacterium]|nr:hypothetical protein [Gemmatimonadaceae bacterium]